MWRHVSVPSTPPWGARRRHWRATAFASLDFETTGLDYDHDAVVSFGVVPVRSGRASVAGSVHQLVTPAVDSSARSMTIHEILPKDLLEAPPLEEAREILRSCIAGRFLLTWYAEVELAFLRRTFGGSRRTWVRRTIDVRQLDTVDLGVLRLMFPAFAAEMELGRYMRRVLSSGRDRRSSRPSR